MKIQTLWRTKRFVLGILISFICECYITMRIQYKRILTPQDLIVYINISFKDASNSKTLQQFFRGLIFGPPINSKGGFISKCFDTGQYD